MQRVQRLASSTVARGRMAAAPPLEDCAVLESSQIMPIHGPCPRAEPRSGRGGGVTPGLHAMRLLTIFWGCSALSAAERVKLLIQTQDANPKIASVSTDLPSPTFLVTPVCCCLAKRRRDWAPEDHCDGSEIRDTGQYFFLTRDPFKPSPRARFPATLALSTASPACPRSRASAPSGVATWPTWSVISVSLSPAFAPTTCQPLSRLPATPTRFSLKPFPILCPAATQAFNFAFKDFFKTIVRACSKHMHITRVDDESFACTHFSMPSVEPPQIQSADS